MTITFSRGGLLQFCAVAATLTLFSDFQARADTPIGSPQRVSIVALVADPDRFDGKVIEVTSWGVIEFEGAALFLLPEFRSFHVTESGVWLEAGDVDRSLLDTRGILTVEGKFVAGFVVTRVVSSISRG